MQDTSYCKIFISSRLLTLLLSYLMSVENKVKLNSSWIFDRSHDYLYTVLVISTDPLCCAINYNIINLKDHLAVSYNFPEENICSSCKAGHSITNGLDTPPPAPIVMPSDLEGESKRDCVAWLAATQLSLCLAFKNGWEGPLTSCFPQTSWPDVLVTLESRPSTKLSRRILQRRPKQS